MELSQEEIQQLIGQARDLGASPAGLGVFGKNNLLGRLPLR